MAKADKKTGSSSSKGVSLSPKDAVVGGGLFGAGAAIAASHLFGWFDYNGKRKKVPALLVTFERDGEEHIESYTTGNGFKPSEDGKTLIPKSGQTGLSESCKAMQYIRALQDECDMPEDFIGADITVLDGIEGTLTRKQLEKVEGSDKAGSILLFTEADSAPWAEGKGKKKSAAKGKKKDADEDEEDDEDEDEESESDDDDDDEEEKPKSKKGGKADAKKGGKKTSKSDDDDEDEDADEDESGDDDEDDEDVVEEATEALIVALEDGPVKIAKIADAVGAIKAVGKSKNKKAILALVATEKFLSRESGWTFNKKAKTVSLED